MQHWNIFFFKKNLTNHSFSIIPSQGIKVTDIIDYTPFNCTVVTNQEALEKGFSESSGRRAWGQRSFRTLLAKPQEVVERAQKH